MILNRIKYFFKRLSCNLHDGHDWAILERYELTVMNKYFTQMHGKIFRISGHQIRVTKAKRCCRKCKVVVIVNFNDKMHVASQLP